MTGVADEKACDAAMLFISFMDFVDRSRIGVNAVRLQSLCQCCGKPLLTGFLSVCGGVGGVKCRRGDDRSMV
ncbi:hypothetical protein PSAB6_340062 [Paraburkholderia sabiae]|nr:hypothetical protein PSAB6_340062 [Paraburkholderia sabiae]